MTSDQDNERIDWLAEGFACLKREDAKAAVACLNLALDQDPRDVTAWWGKASALTKWDPTWFDIGEAALLEWQKQCYEEGLRVRPAELAIRFNIAAIELRLGNYDAAARHLQAIDDAGGAMTLPAPAGGEAFYELLCSAYMFLGDHNHALETVRRGLSAGLESRLLRKRERELQALTASDAEGSSLEASPVALAGGPLAGICGELMVLRELELPDEMSVLVDEVRLKHGSATMMLPRLFREPSCFDTLTIPTTESQLSAPTAARQARSDTSIHIIEAWALAAIRANDTAEAHRLIEVLRLHESLKLPMPALALRDLVETLPLVDMAHVPDGKRSPTVAALSGAWYARQGLHEDAIPHLRAAVDAQPEDPAHWSAYATSLAQAGQPDEALRVVRNAASRGVASDVEALLTRAYLEMQTTPSKAIGMLVQLEDTPLAVDARVVQVNCLWKLGRLDEARTVLREVSEKAITSRFVELYHHLRRALLDEGHLKVDAPRNARRWSGLVELFTRLRRRRDKRT